MATGVPEHEVFAAADAVLARGERPTVERVRLELGRGSPARVGALLDQWWERLAARLRGETRLPGLPTEVAQAFVAVWQQAIVLAQSVAEQSVAAQRQVLAEERERVMEQEARSRLDTAQARQQATEAIAARQVAETRLADLEQLLIQRQTQIDELRQQREDLLSERNDARAQMSEIHQQLQDERQLHGHAREEQQRYTRDVEDRAYREIDRAREESKGLALQLKEANGRLQALQESQVVDRKTLADVHEQCNAAQAQTLNLAEQLDQARIASTQAEEQLHTLLERLQRTDQELAAAQRETVAQHMRAETLEVQLKHLRDTLQSKRRQRS